MRKERKNYTAEEKVAILKRHLVDKKPISGWCDELAILGDKRRLATQRIGCDRTVSDPISLTRLELCF